MIRRVQARGRADRPDGDPSPVLLPRRPLSDTRRAASLLERIRRLLGEGKPSS